MQRQKRRERRRRRLAETSARLGQAIASTGSGLTGRRAGTVERASRGDLEAQAQREIRFHQRVVDALEPEESWLVPGMGDMAVGVSGSAGGINFSVAWNQDGTLVFDFDSGLDLGLCITPERLSDTMLKWIRLRHEYETGDAEFDARFWITSADHPATAALLGAQVRGQILALHERVGLEIDDDIASMSAKNSDEAFTVASSVLRLAQALWAAHFSR